MDRGTRFPLCAAALVFALGCGLRSASAYTAEEHFDYTDGASLSGLDGGTGWGSAWGTTSEPMYALSPGLTYLGITDSGLRADITPDASDGANATIYRTLGESFNSGSLYIGFIARKTVANDLTRYFGIALFTSSTEMMLIGQGSGYANWTVNRLLVDPLADPQILTLDSGVSSQTQSYLLARIDFDGGTDAPETVTFWVNPVLSLTEGANEPIGGQSYTTDRDFQTITRIRLGGGKGNTTGQDASPHWIDEISVSTDSPFAIPEPASWALLLLAAPAALALRRRARGPI